MIKIILLDGFYYLHSCGYSLPDLVTRKGRKTGMEFGFLKGLEALKRFFKDEIIICWEGQNNFRYKIDPNYKANRNIHAKKLEQGRVEEFKNFLTMIVDSAEVEGFEGDDIIASLVEKFCKTEKIVIYSKDKDLRQLIRNKPFPVIQVGNYQQRKHPWTVNRVMKEYWGLRPDQLSIFFAFAGDTVDNIPGVYRVRKPFIAAAIRNGYNPKNLSDYELFSGKEIFALEEHYNSGRFEQNLKLITLKIKKDIIVTNHNWQADNIAKWLDKMEFRTLKICRECGLEPSINESEEF